MWQTPGDAGWSADKLRGAADFAGMIDTAALMIVVEGRVLFTQGRVADRFNVHSIRKSLISAQFDIAEAEGQIDLEATLGKLGIDDVQGLRAKERLATVLDLLSLLQYRHDLFNRKPLPLHRRISSHKEIRRKD